MTGRRESGLDSSGLLIRIWYEPGAGDHQMRARMLSVHDGAEPVPVAAFAGEAELVAAVHRWLEQECRAMRATAGASHAPGAQP
jgi:hypothetical protein